MKKVLLLGVALLLIANVASAQLPPQPYYGLFYDVDRTDWCFEGAGTVTFYFFVLPTEAGVKCVELMVPPPDGFFIFGETYNADVLTPVMGSLPNGLAACFGNCYYEWVQVLSATLMIGNMDPQEIAIQAFPGSDWPKTLDCNDPANELETLAYNNLYTNTVPCPGIANTESTWGAIKNMYE